MKKILGIVVLGLLLSGNAYASIIEFGKCIVGSYSNLKSYNFEWNQKEYQRSNSLYYIFYNDPIKKNGYWDVVDMESGSDLDEEDVKWHESKNYKKITHREKLMYSINTSNGTVTELTIFTDDFMKLIRKESQELRKVIKEKGKLKHDTSNMRRLNDWKKTKIKKYKIADYVGGIIIAHDVDDLKYNVDSRWAIKIDLNTLTVVKNSMERIHEDYQSYARLCTTDSLSVEGEGSSGTAFFVSKKGHLLTNNHVVEGCSVSKITYQNKEYETQLIANDKTLDLALLKAKLKPKSFINFSKDGAKKLNKIYVAGYPLGKGLSDDLKISSGIVSSLKGFEDNSNEIQIDAPINPGNSGGPIINESGDLVAIAVSGLAKDQTEGINFGIKSSAAELFLKSNKVSPSKSLYSRTKDNDDLLKILEDGTVYTYCN